MDRSPMFRPVVLAAVALLCLLTAGCEKAALPAANTATAEQKTVTPPEDLVRQMRAVEGFFRPMGEPGPYDWLKTHPERGQTFAEFLNEDPPIPAPNRRTVYILPLGSLNRVQQGVVNKAAAFLGPFYGLPVKLMAAKKLAANLPATDFRPAQRGIARQIRTGYLFDVLDSQFPADAAALVAVTNEDLYPDKFTNYVFGQSNAEKHLAVVSLARLNGAASPDLFLLRAVKITAHETGHLFGFRHCTKYECLMNGSNFLGETDRHPLDTCPECMAKISWISKVDPGQRYAALTVASKRLGLGKEAGEFLQKQQTVEESR